MINDIAKEELIEQYAQHIVDGMDMDTLVQLAYDSIMSNLQQMTNEQLSADIEEYAPHLLEEWLWNANYHW